MKNLQLLLLSFRKKKWFNLIIMIEITIAITLFVLVLGKINYYTQSINVFNGSKLENVFIYGDNKIDVAFNQTQEQIDIFNKMAEDNKSKIKQVGATYFNSVKLKNDSRKLDGETALTCDLVISDNLKLPLSKGQNFSDIKLEKNVVPVILNYNLRNQFKIGEILDIDYAYEKVGTEQYSNFGPDGKPRSSSVKLTVIPLKIKIIGFLDKENQMFDLNGSGIGQSFPVFGIYKMDSFDNMIFLRTPDNPLGGLNFIKSKGLTWLVEIKPEYIDQKQAIMDEFNTIGNTYTFDKIIEGEKQEFKKNIKIPMINLIIALIITIISIAGLNILLKISERKKYGIYYACGCTWKKCVILDILKGVLLIIIPTMLAFTVATMIGKEDYFMALKPSVYIWALVIAGLIYFVSDFLFNIRMYKTKPVDNLREVE